MALFDTLPLNQFSKFSNFLWVSLFLGKNLCNFVNPHLKTRQPVLPYLTTTLLEGIARSEAKIARLQVYPISIVHARGVTTPQSSLPFSTEGWDKKKSRKSFRLSSVSFCQNYLWSLETFQKMICSFSSCVKKTRKKDSSIKLVSVHYNIKGLMSEKLMDLSVIIIVRIC